MRRTARRASAGDMPGFSTWLAYYPRSRTSIALAINSESADLHRDTIEEAVFGCDGAQYSEARPTLP